jgi:hypothetical protein
MIGVDSPAMIASPITTGSHVETKPAAPLRFPIASRSAVRLLVIRYFILRAKARLRPSGQDYSMW